ncbi:hypothetical protein Bca4012_060094 [Brassica carinata]
MTSKITFFLLLALVTLSVPTTEAQLKKCTTINDCKNIILLCKIGESEQCVHNQCICAPEPEIGGQPCRTTRDCDATICRDLPNKCVNGFCTCTR